MRYCLQNKQRYYSAVQNSDIFADGERGGNSKGSQNRSKNGGGTP